MYQSKGFVCWYCDINLLMVLALMVFSSVRWSSLNSWWYSLLFDANPKVRCIALEHSNNFCRVLSINRSISCRIVSMVGWQQIVCKCRILQFSVMEQSGQTFIHGLFLIFSSSFIISYISLILKCCRDFCRCVKYARRYCLSYRSNRICEIAVSLIRFLYSLCTCIRFQGVCSRSL